LTSRTPTFFSAAEFVSPATAARQIKATKQIACVLSVAQISNLPYRRLPVGRPFEGRGASGLEIRDTAGWKPALLWLRLRRAVLSAFFAVID